VTDESDQRRENVRLNVMTPVKLFNKHQQMFKATTLDISAGGFRASVPGGVWVDERYEVELELPGDNDIVQAVAEAKRRVTEHHVSFAFTQISNRDRERIIAVVFRLQRLALSRGVRPL
jgi:c-di-GMP-binding flagellar brake protein YcgR